MLWGLDVDVFSPDLRAVDLWVTLPARLSHPQLTEVASWGFQDEPEGLYAQARLLVDAHDEAAARELGERLLGELLAGTEARVRALAVAPAPADEPVAPGPEDFESRLVATPWHRHEPIGDGRGLKIVWFSGPCPLERVDVEETAERVTITLHERYPPAFDADGTPNAIAAVMLTRCVEVALQAPLGSRPVYDGATGERPADITPGNYGQRGMRAQALALDLDSLDCQPTPDAISIRPWEARDREHVEGLLRLLSQDAAVSSDDAPTYVAESAERVVGMVTLCVFPTLTGPKAYLDHLVVTPDRRRRGIGRALVRHAIEQAQAAGASRIDLTANDEKQAGRALYESLGFRERDTGSFRLHIA